MAPGGRIGHCSLSIGSGLCSFLAADISDDVIVSSRFDDCAGRWPRLVRERRNGKMVFKEACIMKKAIPWKRF